MPASAKAHDAPSSALAALQERVNAMLDTPLPAESEVWSLRLDKSRTNVPPGHLAGGSAASSESPV